MEYTTGNKIESWVMSCAIMSGISLVISLFIVTSSYVVVKSEAGCWMLQKIGNFSVSQLYWIPVIVFSSWGLFSAWSCTNKAGPIILVFEADSRSYLVFSLLLIDLGRLFISPMTPLTPQTGIELKVNTAAVLVMFTILSLFAKMKQRRAILGGVVHPQSGIRSITWIAICFVPISWIVCGSIDTQVGVGDRFSQNIPKLCFHNAWKWMASREISLKISKHEAFFLPMGSYEICNMTPEITTFSLDAPLIRDTLLSQDGRMEFVLPLSSRKLTCHWKESVSDMNCSIRILGSPKTSNVLISHYPEGLDIRFHELKLPLPYPCYLYRLDQNTFKPETRGFWTRGNSSTEFLIGSPVEIEYMEWEVSSPVTNRLTIRNGSSEFDIRLESKGKKSVSMFPKALEPGKSPYLYYFKVKTHSGIRPVDMDESVLDKRFLGTFINFDSNGAIWRLIASGVNPDVFSTAATALPESDLDLAPFKHFFLFQAGQADLEDVLRKIEANRPTSLSHFRGYLKQFVSDGTIQRIIDLLNPGLIVGQSTWLEDRMSERYIDKTSKLEIGSELKRTDIFGEYIFLEDWKTRYKMGDSSVRLTLKWKSRKEMSSNYMCFIHVVPTGETMPGKLIRKLKEGVSGKTYHFQDDHYPLNGDLMTSSWVLSSGIIEERELVLPKTLVPGSYDIRIGWYNPETGARLRIGTGETYKLLQTVRLLGV